MRGAERGEGAPASDELGCGAKPHLEMGAKVPSIYGESYDARIEREQKQA